MTFDLPQGNYSLYAIPLAWILAQYPNIYAINLTKGYGKQPLPEEVDSDAKPTANTTDTTSNSSKNDNSESKAPAKIPQQQHVVNPLTTALFGPTYRPDAPRSTTYASMLTRILPPAVQATHERAKAAHANAMENLPMFYTALILGNLPLTNTTSSNSHLGLGATTMNVFAGVYLLSRVAYTYFYIASGEGKRGLWMARSAMFHPGLWMCFGVVMAVAEKVRRLSVGNL